MRIPTEEGGRPRARKRFGQHFLEPVWAEKVIAAIAPAQSDTFFEIGPGPGVLTHLLLERTRDVVAFEIDRDLAAALARRAHPQLHVVEGDFLDITVMAAAEQLARLPTVPQRLRVAGNLPYNVASPILFKLTELHAAGLPIIDASVMLQREVADRLLATPGSKEYGVLSVLIGHRARVTRLLQVPAGAFRPAPKVLSTVVRLEFHAPMPPVIDQDLFASLTQAVFTRRRKTLANALLAHPDASRIGPGVLLDAAGIDRTRRPETLTREEFGRLSDELFGLRLRAYGSGGDQAS